MTDPDIRPDMKGLLILSIDRDMTKKTDQYQINISYNPIKAFITVKLPSLHEVRQELVLILKQRLLRVNFCSGPHGE